jgi:hypothetical protein
MYCCNRQQRGTHWRTSPENPSYVITKSFRERKKGAHCIAWTVEFCFSECCFLSFSNANIIYFHIQRNGMVDVDCDWQQCEYQHGYNLPIIYFNMAKTNLWSVIAKLPRRDGGPKFTYIYFTNSFTQIFIFRRQTFTSYVTSYKNTLPKL